MSSQPEGVRINEQDVDAVTERFKSWVSTLPEQDQHVFGWILTRAAASDNQSAARYGMDAGANVPISKLMADAAGVGAGARDAEVTGFQLPKIGPVPIWTYRW